MGKKRKSIEDLVEELKLFHHFEAATALEALYRKVKEYEHGRES